MSTIKVADFEGMQPRQSIKLLPPNRASLAENVTLKRGIIKPMYGLRWRYVSASVDVVDSLDDPVVDSFAEQVVSGQVTAFYLLNDTWISWDVEDIDIVASYISDSDYRIYYTGDGYPKQTDYTLATDGYEEYQYPGGHYTLGIKPPRQKPSVEVKGIGNGEVMWGSRYVYTYVTNWGEESAPSPPSDIVEPEYGQYIELSGFLACEDPDPDNVRGIRVYRIAVGEIGGVYRYVPWPQYSNVSPDAQYFEDYSEEVDYDIGDYVVWTDGNIYICILENGPNENVGLQDPDESTYWTIQGVRATYNVPAYGTNNQVLDDCEDAWDEYVDAAVTSEIDAADYKVGAACIKLTVADGLAEDAILATELIASKDLSERKHIALWIKSSITTAAGNLQILLDDTAECVSPVETLDLPALTADTWTFVKLILENPAEDTAIISVGIKQTIDLGVCVIRIDHLSSNDDYEAGEFAVYTIEDSEGDDYVYQCILANGPGTGAGIRAPSNATYWTQWDPEDIPEDDAVDNGLIDQSRVVELQDAITTDGWDPPPDTLEGLMEFINGVYVGFSGKSLYVSEPYYPYAWPSDYIMQFPYTIVAIGHYGESLIVLTDGRPYLVTGYDPASLVSTPLPFNRPCLSKRGVISTEKGVTYPTDDGMFMINQNGGTLLTRQIWTKDQWSEFDLSNMLTFHYEEQVVVYFSGSNTGFTFFLDEAPEVSTHNFGSVYVRYGRVQDGKLYLLGFYSTGGLEASGILEHGASITPLSGSWFSKEFQYTSSKAFCVAKITGDWTEDGTITFNWYVNGSNVFTKTVTDSNIFKITPVKGKVVQFSVTTTGPEIHEVAIATSVDELKEDRALAGD